MTRNLLTELVIRLLAIWFFIKLIATLLPILIYYKDDGKSFLVNLALFIALFGSYVKGYLLLFATMWAI